MSSSPYFLCVDVGGSKTAASIASVQAEIVGRGYAGSGNLAEVGASRCFAMIRHAVQAAVDSIESLSTINTDEPNDVCSMSFQDIWIGASCDTAFDEAKIAPLLSQYFQRPINATNDALLLASHALRAGTRHGIAVVAGTGSVILGFEIPLDPAGQVESKGSRKPVVRCRKGGNGHLLGDHGSAYHIGVTAARIAADDYTMGKSTESPLYARLCAHYGVQDPGDLPARIHELDSSLDAIAASNKRKLLIAESSAFVIDSIKSTSCPTAAPDPLGLRIVNSCIDTLANDIQDVVTALGDQTCAQEDEAIKFQAPEATLAMTGGVVARPVFRQMLIAALNHRGIRFKETMLIEHAADHGAIGLSKACGMAEGQS